MSVCKPVVFILFLAGSFLSYAQSGNPFHLLKADSVLIYDFEGAGGGSIVMHGKLRPHYFKAVKLKMDTLTELNKRLTSVSSFGGETARCFDPHLGIVYYRDGEPVAYINVCMDCNVLRSSLPLEAQVSKTESGTGDTLVYTGMSDGFRKFLNDLLVRHQFSHQAEAFTSPTD